ncbi:MAG: (Fe-S)-binding protein [Candidatus Bipolaricaulia bacterium]
MSPAKETYWGIPGSVLLWVVFSVAMGLFAQRIYFLYRLVRLGQPENRFDHVKERIKQFLLYVLGQRLLFDEPLIGVVHAIGFFWGFVFYATSFAWTLLVGLFPFLPIPSPEEVGPITLILEIFAILVLMGIAIASYRRYIAPPPHLESTREAAVILILIGSLMVTFLLFDSFAQASDGAVSRAWAPIGYALGGLWTRLGVAQNLAYSLYHVFWWAHALIVLAMLVYIPYSKHLHLLAAPLSVFFGALRGGSLPRPSSTSGASTIRDLTWRELFNAYACAECGRCDRACPALTSGAALSPRLLIHHLKEHLFAVGPKLIRASSLGPTPLSPFPKGKGELPALLRGGAGGEVSKAVTEAELWACTTCLACMAHCPVRNEHLPLIIQMRRYLVNEGRVDASLQDALTKLSRYGNSFGQSDRLRGKWTQGLDFTIKDIRKEPAEYLWFVGDYSSYDPRIQEITRTAAKVFHRLGLDFGILYESERNAGNDVRRVGEEGLFEMLVEKNLNALSKCEFHEIITLDPHTYHVLKNEYPDYGGRFTVTHYTELFARLLENKKLSFSKRLGYRVTYHDPCYLGRYNGVYDAPRKILRALGVQLSEMPRSQRHSYCCGAGGGRIWMEEEDLKERPSESRIREALALDGVQYLVIACPKDIVMFKDAIKTTNSEGRIAVKDVIELIAEAL